MTTQFERIKIGEEPKPSCRTCMYFNKTEVGGGVCKKILEAVVPPPKEAELFVRFPFSCSFHKPRGDYDPY